MKKTLSLLIILTLIINACKTAKLDNKSQNNESKHLQINIKKQYDLGEKINIKIKNVSNNNLVLSNPTKKNFQKKTDKGWISLRILPCPCDAPCKAPPEKMDLPNEKEISINWNQKESYCGKMTDAGIRETIYKEIEKGTYRFIIVYKTNDKATTTYKEFSIK